MAINVTLPAGKITHDPLKDFTHVTLTGTAPLALSVLPTFPVKNLKEFIALAKAKPGSVNLSHEYCRKAATGHAQ